MTRTPLYPLILDPTLHVKVWGGRNLAERFGKALPTEDPYGEAWELHDTSTVSNGPLAGHTLADLTADYGHALIGTHNDPAEGFPLLIKLLDASDWLSVQVHPDDAQAAELEGESRGKTEAWVVLYAEPDARLVIGIQPETPREDMAAAIRNGTLEQLIVYAGVQAGDVLFIPANTVHAIGPGLVIYEVQQSSNTTYRLYDWNRVGLDGNPRELHIEKGVAVSNLERLPSVERPHTDYAPVTTLVESPYFKTNWHHLDADSTTTWLNTYGKFHVLTCVRGEAWVRVDEQQTAFTVGQTVLMPATVGAYSFGGNGDVLRSWQPN